MTSRHELTTQIDDSALSVRDRFPDFLRSIALATVVFGHWIMGAVSVNSARELEVDNVLNVNQFLWPATWVLMLIPLFFFVGGFSNATSISRAHAKGLSSGKWLGRRLKNLLVPVLPFLAVIVPLVFVALALGAPKGLTIKIAVMILMPLWFVIVFCALAAVTPAMFALHKRYGVWVVVAMAVLACLTDATRTVLDIKLVGFANYFFVHGTMQQIGFFYFDGKLQSLSLRKRLLWTIGTFAVLVTTVATPIWSESMVGLTGERSNMSPPSIPALFHGLWLISLAVLAYPWLKERLDRPRVARVLDLAAAYSMRAFLWHLPVMVAIVLVLYFAHTPFPTPGTAAWWVSRPLALAVYALALWGLLAGVDRVKRAKTA